MRISIALGLVAGLAVAPAWAPAWAQPTTTAARVAQCVRDNADQSVPEDVKTLYCTCMANKMSPGETRSVVQWGPANPGDMSACARIAGWN